MRRGVQGAFLASCLWIGGRFLAFYFSCLARGGAVRPRPPGVEAFLPISGLMSARYWLHTGIIHPVHPAALLIFGAVITVSFLFKRSFCSWVCPFGFVSEKLADLGRRVVGRYLHLPRWADLPLRALKYLLLGFLVWVIFFGMNVAGLRSFLDSPFNQTADARLLLFFLHPSITAIVVLATLVVASVFVRHFWCRYLCPYGALTALVGVISPTRIQRRAGSCIDCAKCTAACPARLPVNRLLTVHSDECTLCLECIQSCPVPNTLAVGLAYPRRRVAPLFIALTIAGVFLLFIALGRLSGHWQSSVPPSQLREQIRELQPDRAVR